MNYVRIECLHCIIAETISKANLERVEKEFADTPVEEGIIDKGRKENVLGQKPDSGRKPGIRHDWEVIPNGCNVGDIWKCPWSCMANVRDIVYGRQQ